MLIIKSSHCQILSYLLQEEKLSALHARIHSPNAHDDWSQDQPKPGIRNWIHVSHMGDKDWIITTASQGNWSQEPELGMKHRYADGWWNLAVCCWTQAFLVPHHQIFNWPLFLRLSASPHPHDFTQKFRSASTPYLQPVVSVPEYPLESELKGTEIKRFHAVGLIGQLPVCGLSLQWLQAWGIESCTWSSAPDVTAVTSTQTVLENHLHWWKGILGVWQTHP